MCSAVQQVNTYTIADYKCILLNFVRGYVSFTCNANGTSTVASYSDSSCTTSSGTAVTVEANTCFSILGVYVRAECNGTTPIKSNVQPSGYYDYHQCDASALTLNKYPLGTCITFSNSFAASNFPSTVYLSYSAVEYPTFLNLEFSTYYTPDCSDPGSSKQVLLSSASNCSSADSTMALISSPVIPPLQSGQRIITLFSDSNCGGNAQLITYTTDECIPVNAAPTYVKFTCNPDNSTSFVLYSPGGFPCSGTPLNPPYIAQPSDCLSFPDGTYLTTSCVYKATAQPTNLPTMKPTKAPHTKPTTKPTKKPTKTPTETPTKKPSRKPHVSPTWKPTAAPK